MDLIDLTVTGVQFSRTSQLMIGDVVATFRPLDRPFPHEVRLKVRIKGNPSQTLQEIEEALFVEARNVLGLATQILDRGTLAELCEGILGRRASDAAKDQQQSAILLDDALANLA